MLTLNDGRSELWQWDTGRKLTVDADCSQVHFSNKVFGRSIDVDVTDGVAIIPDILLQTDKDLNVWAFSGTAENGYTKISKTFKVNRRNKPADYVFTPTEQTTLAELVELITAAAEHPPVPGDNGCWMIWDVSAGAYRQSDVPVTVAPVDRTADMTQPVGRDQDGRLWTAPGGGGGGTSGVTPTIGDNGNWYLGDTDTGKPSRGETGPQGPAGADGKSAYQYAVEGGYTGTEAEFAEKMAADIPEAYTLPIASHTVLGGVQPVAKTDSMTQSVGVDEAGALWAPQGSGGAAEREWTMLGEIDISVVGGGNIELTELDNFTEFYVTWETVANDSTTASGYTLSINGVGIASGAIPIQKTAATASYGWIIARYNGLVWEICKSAGAVSGSNITLNSNNGQFPYNHILDVGKATKFQFLAPLPAYQAVSGIITIYGR